MEAMRPEKPTQLTIIRGDLSDTDFGERRIGFVSVLRIMASIDGTTGIRREYRKADERPIFRVHDNKN